MFSTIELDDQLCPNVSNDSSSYHLTENGCSCQGSHYFDEYFATDSKAIFSIRIISSFFSIIATAILITFALLTGKLNKAEVHPLFILSVGDFILSICWFMGGVVWLIPLGNWNSRENSLSTGMCYVLGLATVCAELVTFMLTTVYAMSAFLRIREVYLNQGRLPLAKDKSKKLRNAVTVCVYVASWVLPLLLVLPVSNGVVGLDVSNGTCWCVVDFFNLRPDNFVSVDNKTRCLVDFHIDYSNSSMDVALKLEKYSLILAGYTSVVFSVTAVIIVVSYLLVFYYAKKVVEIQKMLMMAHVDVKKSNSTIMSIKIRLLFFMIIYLFSGLPVLVATCLVLHERDRLHICEAEDRLILYWHAICAPLQGLLNTVVYGWSRPEFRKAILGTVPFLRRLTPATTYRRILSSEPQSGMGSKSQSLNGSLKPNRYI